MDKPLSNITAVLMPCFGTGTRTYENSKVLTEELGVSVSEINISNSVKAHFSDIGHDIAEQDTVYENAQARERTQVLFDIANKLGAVVLGTGDMTENALGFCT